MRGFFIAEARKAGLVKGDGTIRLRAKGILQAGIMTAAKMR